MTTVGTCILCGGGALREMAGFSAYLDLPGNSDSRIVRCAACAMMFLEPYPSPEELNKMYSETYFVADDVPQAKDAGAPLDYSGIAHERMAKFQSTIDLIRTFVPTPARLLDIGAATGEFLDIARRGGYDVAGIELSAYAALQARERFGFEFFVGPLDAYPGSDPFDVIHLSHVLEHLVDVHASIETMSTLLSDKGAIYIEVPFSWNWIEQIRHSIGKDLSFSVWSVHHRSFFRPDSLRAFFARHGFTCRHLSLNPPNRYPSLTLPARAKRAVWQNLSHVGQGLLIEAVFTRND